MILPSLGELEVPTLLDILVGHHGFGVEHAVSAVTMGMFVAGYPLHHDRVTAADAFEIVEAALRER